MECKVSVGMDVNNWLFLLLLPLLLGMLRLDCDNMGVIEVLFASVVGLVGVAAVLDLTRLRLDFFKENLESNGVDNDDMSSVSSDSKRVT